MSLSFALPQKGRLHCHFPFAAESVLLAALCLTDLLTTLFWIGQHRAFEGNPLMAATLARGGVAAFIALKCVFVLLPLGALEWARQYRPRFVQRSLRVGIAAYLVCYAVGVARVNTEPPPAQINWAKIERRPHRMPGIGASSPDQPSQLPPMALSPPPVQQ